MVDNLVQAHGIGVTTTAALLLDADRTSGLDVEVWLADAGSTSFVL